MPRVLLLLSLLASAAAHAQTISIFDIKGRVYGLTAAADGTLWFGAEDGSVKRITPLGEIMTVDVPPSIPMASGPDGTVWLKRYKGLESVNVWTGARKSYDIPWIPLSLAVTPDGYVWVNPASPGGIGRLSPSGEAVLFPVQTSVASMTVGGDGSLWFTQNQFGDIGRITSDGVTSFFPTKPRACCGQAIAPSSDGSLWVTLEDGTIGHLSLSGKILGQLRRPASFLQGMTFGPDGRIWISTDRGFDIVSLDGHTESLAVPGARYGLGHAIAGPDGNVWAVIVNPSICGECPPVEPEIAPAIVRVNLVNPAPEITSVVRAYGGVAIQGLGFVPDTVIRLDGVDRATRYISPFMMALDDPDAARGGTFVAVNHAPGGGESAAYTFVPPATPRRHAVQ